jgi:hypothetical protein
MATALEAFIADEQRFVVHICEQKGPMQKINVSCLRG